MNKLIPIVIVLAVFAAACGANQSTQVVLPTIEAASYPTVQASGPTSNQNVGGYDVSLQRAWRDGKMVYADVCFALPDESDWTIWSTHLDYGSQSITDFSASLLSTQGAENGQPGKRCDQIGFYVPPDADLSSTSLVIESIGARPTPDEYCSMYMPKIQQVLNQRGLGIALDCKANANGVTTMQIISKPASMSDADAQKIVFSDEFYTVKGPWKFSVNLGQ
ncbi:MAG TPA: hypothetical protein VLX61_13615 [Anaerolineales bacterium]|nr:hypothetical protein [Anaerolineales bacterium]